MNGQEEEKPLEIRSAEWLSETKGIIERLAEGTFDWEKESWDGHLMLEGDTDKTDGDKATVMKVLEEKIGWNPEKAEDLVEARFTMPSDSGEPINITCYETTLGEGFFLAKWEHPGGDISWDIQVQEYFDILLEVEQIERVELE